MRYFEDRLRGDVITNAELAERLVCEDLVGVVTAMLADRLYFAIDANEIAGRNRFKNVDRSAEAKPTPTRKRGK